MKAHIKLYMSTAIAFSAMSAHAGEWSGIGALLPRLVQLHDGCADMAKKASDKHAADQYQSTLDDQTAQRQAQLDAQVYGVGHGDRETRDFYLSRLQDVADKSVEDGKKIDAEYASAKQAVAACVQTSETEGKRAYADFKAEKGTKRSDLDEGSTLMTAWLANLDEISVDAPQGGNTTAAQWKTAKAHAELSTL